METKNRWCDVCGHEIKTPAKIETKVGEFQAEVSINLWKVSGLYADYCAECLVDILEAVAAGVEKE